ncbi:DNA repair protein RecN [Silanimonas sp.]|jgi:DNA repair protein RecN (Recombination protein N)|uniref:DNA repair protein RecN n=1 Tax=Silanimonas sp. TaxID=1929290 RepID=UPI0037C83535
MLKLLSLRDFAVVRAAELRFGPGMTVISGETGAGKSLLVDALLWLSGARADAGMVRTGAARAELSAEFTLDDAPDAAVWLAENELDDDGACQLRRVVKADGGSKAWINGRAVSISQLAALGARLVEIHGQHEHQALLDRTLQLSLLDAFGRLQPLLVPVHKAAADWQAAERELATLQERGDVGDRIDYLGHQLDELDRESLAPADIDALLAQHRRAANAGALVQACDRAGLLIGDDDGAAAGIGQALAALSKWVADEPRIAEAAALAESARLQLQEAAGLLEAARDGLELDPDELQRGEQRLSRLHDLSRKHRAPLHDLEARREALRAELEALRGSEGRVVALQAEREAAAGRWREAASALSTARRAQGAALGSAISALMQELGMGGGVFEVAFETQAEPRPNATGAERIELLVSANPGQSPRPLRKVASGGELARIALAIEVATLGLDDTPTMVFDEVDTGIGGAVAEIVGQKLRQLGGGRQVLCVTHLPQVAAQGHSHYRVAKSVSGEETFSQPEKLEEPARVDEIARMLGGVEITAAVRTSAKQMLEKARKG